MRGGPRRAAQGEGASGVAALVEAKGLAQISDPAALAAIVDAVLAASPEQLKKFRGGKTKLQGYFVGRAPPAPGCAAGCCAVAVRNGRVRRRTLVPSG